MLSFSSLSQIPSSPLPLTISHFFPSLMFFLYISSCATRYDPEGPLFLPYLCKGDPPFSRALFHTSFIPLCSSFFSCLIFPPLFSMTSAFICCQALSILLDRDAPVPQPHIYLGNSRADDSPGCQCAAPGLPSGWFCISPAPDRSVKEVGGKQTGGCSCLTRCSIRAPWSPAAAQRCMRLPVCTWKKSWGCVDSSIPGSGRAPRTGQC